MYIKKIINIDSYNTENSFKTTFIFKIIYLFYKYLFKDYKMNITNY